MKKFTLILTILSLIQTGIKGQFIENFDTIQPHQNYENIHVQKLQTDSLSTTFAIWVKLKVKMHKHVSHTENIYVSEGGGTFYLGDKAFSIKKGDLIVVPQNTWHGVDVNSKTPLKVISVQSPEFIGTDRIFKN